MQTLLFGNKTRVFFFLPYFAFALVPTVSLLIITKKKKYPLHEGRHVKAIQEKRKKRLQCLKKHRHELQQWAVTLSFKVWSVSLSFKIKWLKTNCMPLACSLVLICLIWWLELIILPCFSLMWMEQIKRCEVCTIKWDLMVLEVLSAFQIGMGQIF